MPPSPCGKIHLIPGTACDQRLWTNILQPLSAFDLSFGNYAGASSLADMIDCVAEAAPTSCHLVGFSLGGYLAAEAIIKRDINVRSLTLIGTSLLGLSEDEKALRRANANIVTKPTYKGMSRRRLGQFLHPKHLDDPVIGQLVQAMEREMDRGSLKNQLLATINRRDLRALLPTLNVPIHLVGSSQDAICDISPMQEASAGTNICFSDIGMPVAATGHMMPLEAPKALSDTMMSFLDELR